MSFLSWMNYLYSPLTTITINKVESIGIDPSGNRLVVGMGPTFVLAMIQTMTGGIYYSGHINPPISTFRIPPDGIAVDSSQRSVIAYNDPSTGDYYIQGFNAFLSVSPWQTQLAGPRWANAVKFRTADSKFIAMGNFYYGTNPSPNSLTITEIDYNTKAIIEKRWSIHEVIGQMPFKNFVLKVNLMAACIDINVSPYNGTGFFYYDSSSSQLRIAYISGYIDPSFDSQSCMGMFFADLFNFGYFYVQQSLPKMIFLLKITDALNSASADLIKYDYSSQRSNDFIVTSIRTYGIITKAFISGFFSNLGKKVGFIEYWEFDSASIIPAINCDQVPSPKVLLSLTINQFIVDPVVVTSLSSTAPTNFFQDTLISYIPITVPIKTSEVCSGTAAGRQSIMKPDSYPTNFNCISLFPCTLAFTLPNTFKNQPVPALCSGNISIDFQLFNTTAGAYNSLIIWTPLLNDIFTFTFTPTIAQAFPHTFELNAASFIASFFYARASAITLTVNILNCQIVQPPSTSPIILINCYQSEICSIQLPSAKYNYPAECNPVAPPILYTLNDNFNLLTYITMQEMPGDFFIVNINFTKGNSTGYELQMNLVAESYLSGALFSRVNILFGIKVLNRCLDPINFTVPLIPDVLYKLGESLLTLTFEDFQWTPSYCGPIEYISVFNQSLALPNFITFDPIAKTYQIVSSDYKDVDTYNVSLTGQLTVNGFKQNVTKYFIITVEQVITEVKLNTPPFFDPEPISEITVICNKVQDQRLPQTQDRQNDSLKVILTTDANGISQLASLSKDYTNIRFAPLCRANLTQNIQLKIQEFGNQNPQHTIYLIKVNTQYFPKEDASSVSQYSNTAINSGKCQSIGYLTNDLTIVQQEVDIDLCLLQISDVVIYAEQRSLFTLPQELSGSKYFLLEVRLSDLSTFTQYKLGVFTLSPKEKNIGNYTVNLKLIDKKTMLMITMSRFSVRVLGSSKNPLLGRCPDKGENKLCTPKISSVTINGELTVQFPYPIKVYSQEFYHNISQSLLVQLITEKANSTITSWEMIDFKSQDFKLQLTFRNPQEISITDGQPDIVKLRFMNNEYFKGYNTNFKVEAGFSLQENLPPQFDQNSIAAKTTRTAFQIIDKGMTAQLVVNFFLAAFMKLSMKRIWGIINTLQILTLLPKLIPTMPSNTQVCLKVLYDVANLKIIPQDTIKAIFDNVRNTINKWAGKSQTNRLLTEEDAIKGNYENDPENNPSLLDDIGYLVIMAFCFVFILLIILILIALSKKYETAQKILQNIKNKLMFGVFIGTITKGYLKLISSIVEKSTSPLAEEGSGVIPVVLLCIFSSMPILIYVFLVENHKNLKTKNFQNMFGGLYSNLSTSHQSKYVFTVAFLFRRLLYALSIGSLFTDITLLNTIFQILMSQFLCAYIVYAKPFLALRDTVIELMNELTILSVFCMTLGFITDDTLIKGQTRTNIGYAIITVIMINISINLAIFVYQTFKELKSFIIKQYQEWMKSRKGTPEDKVMEEVKVEEEKKIVKKTSIRQKSNGLASKVIKAVFKAKKAKNSVKEKEEPTGHKEQEQKGGVHNRKHKKQEVISAKFPPSIQPYDKLHVPVKQTYSHFDNYFRHRLHLDSAVFSNNQNKVGQIDEDEFLHAPPEVPQTEFEKNRASNLQQFMFTNEQTIIKK